MLCELQSLFFYGLKKPFYSAVSFTLTALFRACFFAVFFAAVALRSTVSVYRYDQLRIRCPSRSAQGHSPYKSYILLKNVITGVFLCLRKVVYSAASFFDRAFSGVFFCGIFCGCRIKVNCIGRPVRSITHTVSLAVGAGAPPLQELHSAEKCYYRRFFCA